MMRILSWNISKRGTNRSEDVVNAVLGHRPDIAILSEYVLGSSTIGRGLNAAGYETIGMDAPNFEVHWNGDIWASAN
jgi:hypothetical protein